MRRVVLASASPRRRELLTALVPDFDIDVSDASEEPVPDDPVGGAVRLALRKARVVAARQPGAVVVGADTVVHDGQRDFGKPVDAAHARAILKALRGRLHTVTTGVAVLCDGVERADACSAHVTLSALPDPVIDAYIATGRPFDKAGAYAIQDDDVPTVAALDGCYCSVMGLPLWTVRALLEEVGERAANPAKVFARCGGCPARS